MNKAKPNDFFITIDGIGRFRFNRKSYGAQIRIDAEMLRILGPDIGVRDNTMSLHALLVGHYAALMVECPDGWEDLEEIDITDDPTLDSKILEVYFKLRDTLDSFRVRKEPAGTEPPVQGAGQAAVQNAGVLAAPEVEHAPDGSPVAGTNA